MTATPVVALQSSTKALAGLEAPVRRVARRVAPLLFGPGVSVGIRLMGEREMAGLNITYRGKRGPTDVLSFPADDEDYAGDLALCVPVAVRQARELGHGVEVELAVLTVHGLVHLAGLDHERSRDEARHQAEVEMGLLSLLRVPVEAALARRGL